MAKSYLVRKGMRPVTQGFADAYRAWLDSWNKRDKRFKPLGKDVTPEQFAEALDALGIDREGRAESLGEVLGISGRQARNILNDPSKLTEERQKKLMARASFELQSALGEAHQIDDLCEHGATAELLSERCELQAKMDAIESAAELLGANHLKIRAEERARAEFVGRATIEAMHTMDARDRATLFRVMMGMLDSYKGNSERDRRARQIADALRKTAYGTRATLGDLADLIAYDHDGYLEYLDSVDQQLEEQSWDEYWPFSYGESDSSIETTVLSEYLGLDG